MFGLKGAGLAGATVVLAGGVAYLVWVYATSSRERRAAKQPGGGGERPRRKGDRKEEEEPLVAAAAAPVAAASTPESSEVRRRPTGRSVRSPRTSFQKSVKSVPFIEINTALQRFKEDFHPFYSCLRFSPDP